MDIDELKRFRQLGSKTAGHPEYGHAPGIETTTGPLGQGLANAVGMALAERLLNARLGDDVVDHHTYVIAGDGCLMEGISHEAISLAGHLKLGKLIVLFDDNGISIDGPTSLAVSDDQVKRFKASGWAVRASTVTIPKRSRRRWPRRAQTPPKPRLIACKTMIGYGAPTKQGKASTHGEPLGDDEIKGTREKLGWPYAAVRGAGAGAARLARRRAARRQGAHEPGSSARQELAAARCASPTAGAAAQAAVAEAIAADQGGVRGDAAQARHARVVADGAGEAGAGAARADRRLGRPHRLQRHAHQASHARRARAASPATTSTTACASTAWPRP